MNRYNLWAILLIVTSFANAQSQWKLKDCIDYGLKNNRSTTVFDNEKEIAQAKAKEALAAYLPTVNIYGTLDDNLQVQKSVIPAGLFGPEERRVAFTQQFNSNVTAQLNQTIFDKSLLTGLKANKYYKQNALLNKQINDETIIYTISRSFYRIFVFREQLALLKTNLETFKEQMDITALRVKKGIVVETDLNRITVSYYNTISQITVAESNLDLSKNELKNAMGYPLNEDLVIDNIAFQMASDIVKEGSVEESFSAANLTGYKVSQTNSKLLEIDQKKIRDGIYPRLSAYARYGGVGFGDQLQPALRNLSEFSSLGLRLEIPVLDFYKRNAQENQARYKFQNSLENLKSDAERYQMEYENANTILINARSNIENDSRNIELAQSVFESTNLQYSKGVADLTDWLNAQFTLKEAQNNYLTSLYNFYLSNIDFQKAKGTLKNFYTSL